MIHVRARDPKVACPKLTGRACHNSVYSSVSQPDSGSVSLQCMWSVGLGLHFWPAAPEDSDSVDGEE